MADYGMWQGAERATGRMATTGMQLLQFRGQQQHQQALEADSARRLKIAEDQAVIQTASGNLALKQAQEAEDALNQPINLKAHPNYLAQSEKAREKVLKFFIDNGYTDPSGVGTVRSIKQGGQVFESTKSVWADATKSTIDEKELEVNTAWDSLKKAKLTGDQAKIAKAQSEFDIISGESSVLSGGFAARMKQFEEQEGKIELERIKQEGKGVPSQTEEQLTARALKGDKEAKAILDTMQQRKRDIAETREGGTRERADRQFAVTLRKEFNALPEVTEYNQTMPKIKSMQSAYEESKKSKNFVAIDQALITLYNKLTDPSSVVRESEYARTAENIPLINQIRGKAEKVLKGGAGLTGEERKALMDMAMLMQKGYEEIRSRRLNEYRGYGVQGGLTPEFLSDATGSMTAPKKVGRFVVEVE